MSRGDRITSFGMRHSVGVPMVLQTLHLDPEHGHTGFGVVFELMRCKELALWGVAEH